MVREEQRSEGRKEAGFPRQRGDGAKREGDGP